MMLLYWEAGDFSSCLTSVVVVVKILVLGLGQDLSVLVSVGCSQVLELPLDIVRDTNKVLSGIHWLLCIHHLVLEEIVNLIHLLMGVHPLLAVRVKVLAAEEYNAPSEPLEMLVWSMVMDSLGAMSLLKLTEEKVSSLHSRAVSIVQGIEAILVVAVLAIEGLVAATFVLHHDLTLLILVPPLDVSACCEKFQSAFQDKTFSHLNFC